jgi:hypothetical protein
MKDNFSKATATFRLVRDAAKRLDIGAIRQKHGFTGNRVVRMHFGDVRSYFTTRFDNIGDFNILEAMRNMLVIPEPNVEIYFSSVCIIKHIRNGYIAAREPGSLKKVRYPYSPLDAWKFGDVTASGDSSTNDILAFVGLLRDVMESIDAGELERIIGTCEHD